MQKLRNLEKVSIFGYKWFLYLALRAKYIAMVDIV